MKHPIKMSRIKHILAITLSLLLIAIIADAQVSQRRRAQPPQPQRAMTTTHATDAPHKYEGCFHYTFNNNGTFTVSRVNGCNQPAYVTWYFGDKNTENPLTEKRSFYFGDSPTKDIRYEHKPANSDIFARAEHTTDPEFIRKSIEWGISIADRNPFCLYDVMFKNKTNMRVSIHYKYWSKDKNGYADGYADVEPHGINKGNNGGYKKGIRVIEVEPIIPNNQ